MPEVKWKLSFDTCKLWVGTCEEEETKNGNVHRKGQVACKQEDACVLGDGWWSKQIKIKISRFGNKLNRKIPSPGNFWHHLSPTTLANALLVTREAWQVSACKQSNQKTWGPATTAEPSCDVNQVHIWRNLTKRERERGLRGVEVYSRRRRSWFNAKTFVVEIPVEYLRLPVAGVQADATSWRASRKVMRERRREQRRSDEHPAGWGLRTQGEGLCEIGGLGWGGSKARSCILEHSEM